MNWQKIKVSPNGTHFLFNDKPIFGRYFTEVLKFHSPGLAPVKDETGAYHIDTFGEAIYEERYARTFGYYCNRASVIYGEEWFHLNEKGERAYSIQFTWTGNYQEDICAVRDNNNHYCHIDVDGNKIYAGYFVYCGDYKDGVACVKSFDGFYRHIDVKGNFINNKSFLDLGIFHKNYATAKDSSGWHHIDKNGYSLYPKRYAAIEPFYNGYALVTDFEMKKFIINESGKVVLQV
ncbi:MAG TPA: WG repeat-containing protein [Chitinophagales bacterium]|nr:WG repeat-containing protein [Chitinophagales bacterium]